LEKRMKEDIERASSEDEERKDEVVEEESRVEEEDIETLKAKLSEAESKAQDYLANWQRAQADFINFKRRTEQERAEAAKFANAMLILNLLPILDDLERALDNVSTKLAGLTWVDGIRLIYRKFQAVLESQGLSQIEAEGADFDPNLHEAVMYADGEEGKVVAELQKGYKLHDRVIRPAMVSVGRRKTEEDKEDATEPSKEETG